ncbi:MAG: (d)CMP kinase [Gemmatimonadota bacterium]
MNRITIAIDGPAASGKSTTARSVAERLGYAHLNSGLLYRAITWTALRDGWLSAEPGFDEALAGLEISLVPTPPTFSVAVNGAGLGEELYSSQVAARVSAVASRPAVRKKILDLLQATEPAGVVCDGRDIGTVVFPNAGLKVFLVASAEERGRRRLLEQDEPLTEERIRRETERLEARDEVDSSRELAPLLRAMDAIEIDTTVLDPAEVIDTIMALADERTRG